MPTQLPIMPTTSLKLSDELELRATKAAQKLGISPHAFMVDAIRQAADAVEQRSQFVEQALAARVGMLRDELGHDADEVRDVISGLATRPDYKGLLSL